jgi:hypothetical protein
VSRNSRNAWRSSSNTTFPTKKAFYATNIVHSRIGDKRSIGNYPLTSSFAERKKPSLQPTVTAKQSQVFETKTLKFSEELIAMHGLSKNIALKCGDRRMSEYSCTKTIFPVFISQTMR